MKYLPQIARILAISLLGELCHSLIPFPIPASIYGMVLLFLALCTGLLKTEQLKQTGDFLVNIMGVLFVCPAVGILNCGELLRQHWAAIAVIMVVSLVITFAVSGLVTQFFLKKGGEDL